MANAFVWFHHSSDNRKQIEGFYGKLLGWKASDGPGGLTMLAAEKEPFAGTGERYGDAAGWIPFVEVSDVDVATKQAVKLGGAIIRDKARGPAGAFSVVRDPGGARSR